MVEPILFDNMEKAPTKSNLSITSNDINIELSKEFLVELRKNMYCGTYNEDMVDHIAKILKMVDLIYVPGADSHQLRMKIFPLSLADDAKEWWISEGDEKITSVNSILNHKMEKMKLIMEYLVNISKRRAFWSLNEDILKITILKTNTSYPSRKIRRIRAYTHQRPQRKEDQYAVSRRQIRRIGNIVCEYSGRYQTWSLSKKLQYAVSNPLDTSYRNDFQTV
ncbi:hypothetical protein Tco_0912262 [Tanacetum coccineum]